MSDPPFSDTGTAGGKEPGALRTIGEVSAALGIRPHVLRYWEGQFPMLQPLKRSGGRRYYRAGDVALLQRINRLLNEEGYTVRGAGAVLAGPGAQAGVPAAAKPSAVSAAAAAPPPDGDEGFALRIGAPSGDGGEEAAPRRQLLPPDFATRLSAIRDRLREALAQAA